MTISMAHSDDYDDRLAKAKRALDKARLGTAWKAKRDAQRPVPCEHGYRYSDAQIKRVLEALHAAEDDGHVEDAHEGDHFVSDWYRGAGDRVSRNWVVKVYYPSQKKPGSAIWCSGWSTLDAIVNHGILKERPIVSSYDPDVQEDAVSLAETLLSQVDHKEVICPYCNQMTRLVDSAEIYNGKSYGLAYWCEPCDAYVGCHKGTADPFGTPANKALRGFRQEAHKTFDPLWRETGTKRWNAYHWLASKMGLSHKDCHIARFNIEQCNEAIFHCMEELVRLGLRRDPGDGFASGVDGLTNEGEEG
jgi:hypothetical protein